MANSTLFQVNEFLFQLKDLGKLYKSGVIDKEEFISLKANIMSHANPFQHKLQSHHNVPPSRLIITEGSLSSSNGFATFDSPLFGSSPSPFKKRGVPAHAFGMDQDPVMQPTSKPNSFNQVKKLPGPGEYFLKGEARKSGPQHFLRLEAPPSNHQHPNQSSSSAERPVPTSLHPCSNPMMKPWVQKLALSRGVTPRTSTSRSSTANSARSSYGGDDQSSVEPDLVEETILPMRHQSANSDNIRRLPQPVSLPLEQMRDRTRIPLPRTTTTTSTNPSTNYNSRPLYSLPPTDLRQKLLRQQQIYHQPHPHRYQSPSLSPNYSSRQSSQGNGVRLLQTMSRSSSAHHAHLLGRKSFDPSENSIEQAGDLSDGYGRLRALHPLKGRILYGPPHIER